MNMNLLGWLVGCIFLDLCVITTNVFEHIIILKSWKHLDRIDHLLLSLSTSDLLHGAAVLSIDAWYLARDVTLKKRTITIKDKTPHAPCKLVQSSQTNETLPFLERYHQLVTNCIFESAFLFTLLVSVLHVKAIAIERIVAVRFPRKYYIFTKFRTKLLTVCLIWLISFVLTLLLAGGTIFTVNDKHVEYFRGAVLSVIIFSVFLAYITVAWFLFKQHRIMSQDFASDSSIDLGKLRRLTKICLFLGISYVACNAPISLSYFQVIEPNNAVTFMVTLNSLINPGIYFVKVYYDRKAASRLRGQSMNADTILGDRKHARTLTSFVDDNGSLDRRKPRGSPFERRKENDLLLQNDVSQREKELFEQPD